ncbi:MAG: copper resistance protein NlpE [Dysgonamonadaceae bacterium]|jgi:uncharacterized lipoprotein NlpE involved in copper resistance|nr:copper resistance protein NlpE [Dysgonamonadaceae bacterium]
MKKSVVAISIIAVLVLSLDACKSKNESKEQENQTIGIAEATQSPKDSVSWAGSYTGTVPCADCTGIRVHLVLNSDETYQLHCQYLGKENNPDYSVSGKFTWNDAKDVITLDSQDWPRYYQIGENKLTQLDTEGKLITGELADKYVLTKSIGAE